MVCKCHYTGVITHTMFNPNVNYELWMITMYQCCCLVAQSHPTLYDPKCLKTLPTAFPKEKVWEETSTYIQTYRNIFSRQKNQSQTCVSKLDDLMKA